MEVAKVHIRRGRNARGDFGKPITIQEFLRQFSYDQRREMIRGKKAMFTALIPAGMPLTMDQALEVVGKWEIKEEENLFDAAKDMLRLIDLKQTYPNSSFIFPTQNRLAQSCFDDCITKEEYKTFADTFAGHKLAFIAQRKFEKLVWEGIKNEEGLQNFVRQFPESEFHTQFCKRHADLVKLRLKKAIGVGAITIALDEMIDGTEIGGDPALNQELYQLRARIAGLRKQMRQGTIRDDDAKLEKARIITSLLKYVEFYRPPCPF